MKKLLFCLTLLTTAAWITACDDDDDKKVANEFKAGDNTYALSEAYVDSTSTQTVGDKEFHMYDVVVASSGITFSETSGFTGTGDAVRFKVYTTQDGWVPAATYTLAGTDNGIQDLAVFVGFGGESPMIYDSEIDEAEIKVSKSGDSHVFNFDFTLEDGAKITGSFKGEVNKVDSF